MAQYDFDAKNIILYAIYSVVFSILVQGLTIKIFVHQSKIKIIRRVNYTSILL